MQATIRPDGNLRVEIDSDERAILSQTALDSRDSFVSDETMFAEFESLVANSEYDWVLPEYIGALTDAPILGVYGQSVPGNPETDGGRLAGCWKDDSGNLTTWIDPVEKAFWYPNYMIRSPQEDLAEYGFVIFEKGSE